MIICVTLSRFILLPRRSGDNEIRIIVISIFICFLIFFFLNYLKINSKIQNKVNNNIKDSGLNGINLIKKKFLSK